MHSAIKIMTKNPTGFPNSIPLISFIIPNKKIRPAKYNVVFGIVSVREFIIKTEA
jgi:hypothetical protein